MSKDPAFLFYSQDFIVGVQTLNFEDRGKYITILAQMHQQGRMDEETISFMVGSVSVSLKNKFSVDENGLWYNERLEKEIAKRAAFVESRRENGRKGGRGKKPLGKPNGKPLGKPNGEPLGEPTQNLPENENIYINSIDINSSIDTKNSKYTYSKFYDEELTKSENNPDFEKFIKILFGENSTGRKMDAVLRMPQQMTWKEFQRLMYFKRKYKINVTDIISAMNNNAKLKERRNLWLTFSTYMRRQNPQTAER